ncbi:MAG: DUF6481 family protein [Janthinobacterium lividum]
MSAFKGAGFNDRRDAAANAKKALLEKFKSRPAADDPAILQKQAEMKAIADAREVRAAERAKLKEADLVRLRAEEEAALVEKARLAAEAEEQRLAALEREEAIKAERKAARDAKYAARKARR